MAQKTTNTIIAVGLVGLSGAVIGHLLSKPDPSDQKHVVENAVDKKAPLRWSTDGTSSRTASGSNADPSAAAIKSHIRRHIPPSALANERTAIFKNDQDYQQFLGNLKARGLTLLGNSDALHSVRFSFDSGSNLSDIEGGELGFNFPVSPPSPPNVSAQEGAIGFGSSTLEWLGLDQDNSAWGEGVTVAVIDSGVNDHLALNGGNGDVEQINLSELPPESDQLSHGTAVASIISGDHFQTKGVAPAADILSIRVTNENGTSDSFTLAEAIVQAADSGADVINISLGSQGDSLVVANAVEYAQDQGSVIVASAGNSGVEGLAFPAGNEGVISVGAVEAGGEHLDFSNTGSQLDIVAPGFQVNAAWEESQLIPFTGTSASAPLVSGTIAAVLSLEPDLSPAQAAERVISLSNDAGSPGADSSFGTGVLAIDRIVEFGTPNIFDAAVTGQVIDPTTDNQILVTVQNQGTETLINSPVTIEVDSNIQQRSISNLAPGEIQTFEVSTRNVGSGDTLSVNTTVNTNQADKDINNNSFSTTFEFE